MTDLGRPHDNLYEVALWADMLQVSGDELFYAYVVDNQAIAIPETIDAIRALSGIVEDANESIAKNERGALRGDRAHLTRKEPVVRIVVLGGGFGGVTTARHLEASAGAQGRDHAREQRGLLRPHAAAVRSVLRTIRTAALRPADPRHAAAHALHRGER